ncbi:hypothetical protein L9W94_12530, partial [Vibrio aestuarianus]|nr:hypothetical protein [Vibrio aestuarianus]
RKREKEQDQVIGINRNERSQSPKYANKKKHVQKLRQAGYQAWCYAVNNPKKLRRLKTINAVFSGYTQTT